MAKLVLRDGSGFGLSEIQKVSATNNRMHKPSVNVRKVSHKEHSNGPFLEIKPDVGFVKDHSTENTPLLTPPQHVLRINVAELENSPEHENAEELDDMI